MSFNRWASGTDLQGPALRRIEDIWDQLISAGNSEDRAGRLLRDAIEEIQEFYRDKYRRW